MLNQNISSYGFICGNPNIWLWRKMRERYGVVHNGWHWNHNLCMKKMVLYQARTKDTGKYIICPDVHSCKELSKPSCSLVVLSKIFQEAIAKAYIGISFDNCIISYNLMVNAALHHLVTGCRWRGKQACISMSSSGLVYPWSLLCRFALLS